MRPRSWRSKHRKERSGPRTIVYGTTDSISVRYLLKGQLSWMQRQGWDVTAVASGEENLEVARDREGVDVHHLPMSRPIAPIQDLTSLVHWVTFLARVRPRAVNVGTPKASLLGGMAAWGLRVPVRIYVIRGFRADGATGARKGVLRLVEKLTIALSTQSVAVSHDLAKTLLRERIVPRGRAVAVIGDGSSNGVDAAALQRSCQDVDVASIRAALGIPDGSAVIGFVGRLTADKGVDTLLAALQHPALADRDNWVCLCLGAEDGESRLLEAVSSHPRILALGQQPDPWSYMSIMDVLCLPSRREGFPNVVLEAAALGVPAVVSDVTGCRDSVVPFETGLIVPPADAEALARALLSLVTDEQKRAELGDVARTRAVTKFRPERIWQALASLYDGRSPSDITWYGDTRSKRRGARPHSDDGGTGRRTLVVTTHNVLSPCGELSYLRRRSQTLRDEWAIETDVLAVVSRKHVDNQKEPICQDFRTRVIPVDWATPVKLPIAARATLRSLKQILAAEEYSAVVLCGGLTLALAPFVRRWSNDSAVVADIHGSSEDMLHVARSSGLARRLVLMSLYGVHESVSAIGLHFCDALMTVSTALGDYVDDRYSVCPPQRFVVPSACAPEVPDPATTATRRERYRDHYGFAEGDIVFGYAGSTSSWQCLEEGFDIAHDLREAGYKVQLLLLVVARDRLPEKIRSAPWVTVDSVASSLVEEVLCAADYLLLLRGDNIVSKVAFPTKFLEYLKTPAWIVTSPYAGEVADIVRENDLGLVTDFDASDVRRHIDRHLTAAVDASSALQRRADVLVSYSFRERLAPFMSWVDERH